VGHVIALVTHGLSQDQPPEPLVQLPDWRKSGLGATLAVGFVIETWAAGALAGTVVVVVGVVVGFGTVVVGVRTVVVGVVVVSVCAVNLATGLLVVWVVEVVLATSFFATCATAFTTCLGFTVVDVTVEVATTVVVVPDPMTALGRTVAIGPAKAISTIALSDSAIVLATTW
jgi:hypothetical protein